MNIQKRLENFKRNKLARASCSGYCVSRPYAFGVYPSFSRALNYWSCEESAVSTWRNWGTAEEVSRASDNMRNIWHTGWYADDFQEDLYTPHVWQLPSRNRVPQFIAGFTDGYGFIRLCASNFKLDTFDTKEDAARAADRFTEIMAEHARDYSAADSLEQFAKQQAQDAFSEAREALAALREQKALGGVGARVCAMLSANFRRAHADARKALGKLPEARDAMRYAEQQSNRYAGVKV